MLLFFLLTTRTRMLLLTALAGNHKLPILLNGFMTIGEEMFF